MHKSEKNKLIKKLGKLFIVQIFLPNKQLGCSAKRAWRQNLQEGFAREQLMPTYN